MAARWTQAAMRDVALQERADLSLTPLHRLDPYRLAAAHGILVYPADELADELCPAASIRRFVRDRRHVWSAALIPIGSARVVIENTAHTPCRRRSSITHELSHHLLEHEFEDVLLAENGCRRFDAAKERQALFLSGELLVPSPAAVRAAFDGRTDREVARAFGVSEQFARMRMAGARVRARRALARQRDATSYRPALASRS